MWHFYGLQGSWAEIELEEKEKWCVDEVKRLKAIVVTVVGTKTRLSTVEYKQWSTQR